MESAANFLSSLGFGPFGPLVLELIVALLLGLIVGYERTYRGRAAGMRTYGFVCMASCALTAIAGYQHEWFHGQFTYALVDPTRVVQGIITGIGFLGAGVIMRDGLNISGLTTAASIWSVAAIGVLVGVGFYMPATVLALLMMITMLWGYKIEMFLPVHHAVTAHIHFRAHHVPDESVIAELFKQNGYRLAKGSFATKLRDGCHEWRFVLVAPSRSKSTPLTGLAQILGNEVGVMSCHFSHSRN